VGTGQQIFFSLNYQTCTCLSSKLLLNEDV